MAKISSTFCPTPAGFLATPRSGARLRFGPVALGIALGFFALRVDAAPVGAPAVSALKKLSLEQLMDLEVTSVSKRPEKLSETASAIQVITGDDIRRAGAQSLPEALRLATNLQTAQIDSRQWAISARGFNSSTANKLLVLVDGRTIYSPLHSGVFWDAQDVLLEDIDRIEVISGPGATQWGANAVNGVINITSKSAQDTQGTLVLGGGGGGWRDFGAVRHGGVLAPNVYYRVYVKQADRDATELSTGRDAENDWRLRQGGFRVDWNAASDTRFTLQGDVYHDRIGQLNQPAITLNGGNLLGRWSRTLADQSRVELQVYYDRTHRSLPASLVEDVETSDVDFRHQLSVGAQHQVVWGFGYRLIHETDLNPPTLAFLPAHVSRSSFNAFAQDEIALAANRLNLTLGAKLEHNYYTGVEFEPSLRLAWLPTKTQTVWAAVSRAIRTPSRIDREFFAPRDPPFTQLQGGPNFVSEELIAYELGWRMLPTPWLSVALSTFYHDYDRLRTAERINPPLSFPIVLGNGQRGSVTGAELTADARVTSAWRLQAGVTQMHLDLRNKAGSTAAAPTNTDPERQFLLRSSLDLPGRFEFDATYRFVARLAASRVPAYDELDVRLGWSPTPAWEFSLVGQNLLRPRHGEFNAPASRQFIERAVFGKAVWRF